MQKRLPLSVAVITLNEEERLSRCLDSVRDLASEIVVVDSGSKDGTERVARAYGAQFSVQPWQGHVVQKNRALAACSQPWVLGLDADEAVSPELAASLRQLLSDASPIADGYEIDRRTFYLGQWVNHCWSPEWRLRLIRRGQAQWTGRDPHDRLEVSGNVARLKGDLLHYSYRDFRDHLERTIRYARISADSMEQAGGRCRWYNLVISPWLAFSKRLFLKQGFRDGWRGWIIAVTTFFSVFAKYAFLFEKELGSGAAATRSNGASPTESPRS